MIRFGGIETPTLEQARPQLEAQTLQQAAAAGQKYLQGVAGDLGVDVNPRYGTWKPDQLAITDFVNPVIKPTPSPAPPSGGTLPGGRRDERRGRHAAVADAQRLTRPAPAGAGDPARTVVAVDRLLLVTSSPRLPAGLLSWPAWEALRSGPVHALDPTDAAGAGRAGRRRRGPRGAGRRGRRPRSASWPAADGTAVWLAGPDGDRRVRRGAGRAGRRRPPTPSWRSWPAPGIRRAPGCSTSSR